MQCKKLCSLTKPLENTISLSYTFCFGVQCCLCWTNQKLLAVFASLLVGGNKVNMSCYWRGNAGKCVWLSCQTRTWTQPTTPMLYNTPARLQKDFERWMPPFLKLHVMFLLKCTLDPSQQGRCCSSLIPIMMFETILQVWIVFFNL